ncbi:thrombospondin type 3 repeat-containing protein [Candidatus Gracilibacteria bacterium]|nr:thrombospondin type 3 repeat-containing protein [Candidatus Gracilibacteria bacterium]
MKKIYFVFGFFFFSLTTFAEEPQDFSRFEKQVKFSVSGIITPKVVKFETKEYFGNQTILLDEKGNLLPHKWVRSYEKTKKQNVMVSKVSSSFEGQGRNLIDGNFSTKLAFHPEKDLKKKIVLKFKEQTDVSGIIVHVDDGIIAPQKVSVRGLFKNNEWVNIVSNISFSHRIPFPTVSLTGLEISYKTPHFLRLTEIEILGQKEIEKKDELIFFAEENKNYTLLSNSHFGQKNYYSKEQQPLHTDTKTPVFTLPFSQKNPKFNPDFDGDGINDSEDLCPKFIDPENMDKDKNGRGDFCEDPDLDNIYSNKDNCPFKYNPDQLDSDQDSIGDVCDDKEGRWTENQDYLLWIVFTISAGFLGFLVFRSFKK